ncbi:hypothetical protein B0J11DRAFT_540926 [Dendryphion nanum]|uniref:Zn(2)-C6 fungal-type domain-containing protein n=1 Tax=Dendryphion nanum TaxID=256645 RepID=A0A9P9IC12_9PLEO|nr:hypothetical protein B0J11DRAFT_540926 [Dendryphion nanum]
MSTRRSHNKTRLGCSQCKKRRIKCDGQHPLCVNCDRKGLDCSFLLLVPSHPLLTKSTPIASTSSRPSKTSPKTPYQIHVIQPSNQLTPSRPSSLITLDPLSDDFSLPLLPKLPPHIDLKDVWKECHDTILPYHHNLLAHYKNTTCLTLATDGPGQTVWQSHVPRLANEHKFLIHGILSVASLHVSRLHEGKPERDDMNAIAADQMNRALAHFRVELGSINKDNAPALFACSTITAVYFFRTSVLDLQETQASIPPHVTEPPPELVDRSIHSIIRTFWALRGALSVLQPAWDWVVDSEISPVCTRRWWPQHWVPANPRALIEDQKLHEIEKLWARSGSRYGDSLTAALSHLRNTYGLVSLLTDPGREYPQLNAPVPYSVDDTTVGMLRDRAAMFTWVTSVSKEFIALVEEKNVEALVIVAHYAVLLGRVRNVWWMDGLGAGMLRAIAMALGREHLHLLAWPAQVLDVDVERRFGLDGVGRETGAAELGTLSTGLSMPEIV